MRLRTEKGQKTVLVFSRCGQLVAANGRKGKKGAQEARDKEVIFQPNHPQNLQPN